MPEHGLGWRPQLPDHRDYTLSMSPTAPLPASVDLRPSMPPVGDQGQIGSCTAWASTAAYRYEMDRQKLADFEPSELAQYYWTRAIEGTTKQDAGASIRDAIKNLAKTGAAPEALWPYDVAKFAKAPPASVKAAAKKHVAIMYAAVNQSLAEIKGALAAGFPIVFGISVYESFEGDAPARTGVILMPGKKEQLLGGHAIVLVGYDDATQRFTFRNSWGQWGDKGYGYLPYVYVTSKNLASDFWTLRSVS